MKTLTVLERVQKLEKAVSEMQALGGDMQMLRQTIGETIEVVQAILVEQGPEYEAKIEARIQAKRDEARRERDARAADAVAQMLETGVLAVGETIGEDCLIVGREFNTAGEVTSERVQAVFAMFSDGVKEAIKGQGVGAIYETPQGKFEVLEVYQFVQPTLPAPEAPVVTPVESAPVVPVMDEPASATPPVEPAPVV